MKLSIGDQLPSLNLQKLSSEGPQNVNLSELSRNKKIVIFAVSGAYSDTCSTAHMPSFIRVVDDFRARGIQYIVCISVNDVFVLDEWAKETGANLAGIEVLSDGDASFTKAMGMNFSLPDYGLYDRSQRYAMLVENGVIVVLQCEESSGECTVSSGESLLAAI